MSPGILAAALVLAATCPASASGPATSSSGSGGVAVWHRTTGPSEYDATTLSHLIDGGAEVYLDYGFTRAVTAEYESGDETITCTVYEMADAQAAFGVFSYFRGGHKTPLPIGDGAFGSDSQIAFWQARYFVTIETFSSGASRLDQLKAFAAQVSTNIALHAPKPGALDRLPTGRLPGSERLLRGRLAGNALYTAWPSAALTFDRADMLLAARYGEDGPVVWVVPFRDRAALDFAWQSSASRLRPDAGCDPAPSGASDLVCVREGRAAAARRVGTVLAIVSGADSIQSASALLDRIQP